jgi:hypothetical protein
MPSLFFFFLGSIGRNKQYVNKVCTLAFQSLLSIQYCLFQLPPNDGPRRSDEAKAETPDLSIQETVSPRSGKQSSM